MKNPSGAMFQALESVRDMVITGALGPGEQIRQEEMAEQLELSRVPLREALNVLADQGLLLHRRNQGYFVAKREPDELRQITRMLALLEAELVASLEWPTAAQLGALHARNAVMRKLAAGAEWRPLVIENRAFHFAMFELSPQKLVVAEVGRLWTLGDPFIAIKLSTPAARAQTVVEHDALLSALARRDRGQFAAALDEHRTSTAAGLPGSLLRRRTGRRKP